MASSVSNRSSQSTLSMDPTAMDRTGCKRRPSRSLHVFIELDCRPTKTRAAPTRQARQMISNSPHFDHHVFRVHHHRGAMFLHPLFHQRTNHPKALMEPVTACSFYFGGPGLESTHKYRYGGYHPVHLGDVYCERYRVIHKLGFGSYSTVWLARDLQSTSHT